MNWERDKKLHALAGFLIAAAVGFAFVVHTDWPILTCAAAGFAIGTVVGWSKEYLYDAKHQGKRTVDEKDWYATSFGSLVGAVALVVVSLLIKG